MTSENLVLSFLDMRDFTVLVHGNGRKISIGPIRPISPTSCSQETVTNAHIWPWS
jgi:hypothetical protein